MKSKKPEFLIEAESNFKKIWNLLSDNQVVRFGLSVKLYRDDSSEPEKILMQGERSVNSGWKISLPRDHNSDALQSPEALKGKLASITGSVQKYIMENGLSADWKEVEALINEKMKSGLSVEFLEYRSEAPIRAVAAYGYEAHFCAPIMATVYAIEGAAALAKNDLDHASYCVDRGLYWSDSDMFIPNPKDRFTERAREGGKGKALGHEPVKAKVAELMLTLRPEGWKSTQNAIDTVSNEMTSKYYSFVEDCGLSSENLSQVIRRWVRATPERFPHRIKSKV